MVLHDDLLFVESCQRLSILLNSWPNKKLYGQLSLGLFYLTRLSNRHHFAQRESRLVSPGSSDLGRYVENGLS